MMTNLVLLLALLWVIRPSKRPGSSHPNTPPAPIRAVQGVTAEQTPAGNSPGRTAFRWSQLESTDYRQYLANLRGIGCPEQTIRDIITADVGSLYDQRRNALKASLVDSALRRALEELAQEQAAVLLALLGPEPSGPSVVAKASPRRFVRRQSDHIALPLVLQQVDLAGLNFSARQFAAIAEVRKRFEQQLESCGLAPDDPAYRGLWQTAQAQSDDLLQAMIGGERYIDYQLAARNAPAIAGLGN